MPITPKTVSGAWVMMPGALGIETLSGAGFDWILIDGESATLTAWSPRIAAWFSDGAATVYYLAPFRVFEFAIGAAMVWAVARAPRNRIVAELLALAGLVAGRFYSE